MEFLPCFLWIKVVVLLQGWLCESPNPKCLAISKGDDFSREAQAEVAISGGNFQIQT